MNHVMLDLETMGKYPGCAIVSIGAVRFDPITKERGEEFYAAIDLESCSNAGLTIDPDTVMWWMRQSEPTRLALTLDRKLLRGVLLEFLEFMAKKPKSLLWSHGASFDPPILEVAYKACNIVTPWLYGNVRDTRTIYDLANVRPDRMAGIHHNALADANNQALAVIESYTKLGK